MSLFSKTISKHQFKSLIKQLETLNYDAIISGLDDAAIELVHNEDPKYFKAILAIKKCMEDLKEMYKEEG